MRDPGIAPLWREPAPLTVADMRGWATTLHLEAAELGRLEQKLRSAAERQGGCSAVLLFLSGPPGNDTAAVATLVARALPGVPALVVSAAGVLTDEHQEERSPAIGALLLRSIRCSVVGGIAHRPEHRVEALAESLAQVAGSQRDSILVFSRTEGMHPRALDALASLPGAPRIFGAGTVGADDPTLVAQDGSLQSSPLAAIVLHGPAAPTIGIAGACRALAQPLPITRCSGPMVLELGGRPALDVLQDTASNLPDRPQIFTLVQFDGQDAPAVLRPIQGVDPSRKGIMVSEEVSRGQQLAFAIRDGMAAREQMDQMLAAVERGLAGSAPGFGVYLDCTGRGQTLYGAKNVDRRLIRTRFPGLPLLGMQSSFEIAPVSGRPLLHLFTGVLAVYGAPS
jgi:small ligand-binding sensory domain FIST